MPRRKSSKSLKKLCLENIAVNFDTLWCKSYDEFFADMPRIVYVIGPMEMLTNDLTQLLIQELQKMHCLRAKHLPVLLHEGVQKFDLPSPYIQDKILKSLPWRCPNMVHLNLNCFRYSKSLQSKISVNTLKNMIEGLPRLESLTLQEIPKHADNVLYSISKYSKSLVLLNLKGNKLTQNGLQYLCDNFLPKLRHVDVTFTSLKPVHFVNFLNVYKHLNNLMHENSALAVYEAFQKCGIDKMPEMRLKSVHCADTLEPNDDSDDACDHLTMEIMAFVCHCCTFVTHVDLGCINGSLLPLRHLKDLQNLRSLVLHDHKCADFKDLLDILSLIGSQISELKLIDFIILSLEAIANFCPNLKIFHIHSHTSGTPSDDVLLENQKQKNAEAFTALESFTYIASAEEGTPVLKSTMKTLLECAKNLKTLELICINTLTNDALINAVMKHSFKFLHTLKLIQCDSIEGEAVKMLIETENDLSVVNLHYCKRISLRDYEEMMKFCKSSNLDIDMTWA